MPPLRIGMVSTYPPIHCGVGEYTRLLLVAMHGASPETGLIVLAEEGVGREYYDEDAGARVVPVFRSQSPGSYRHILDVLQDAGGVDILHVQHEYGIYGRNNSILEAVVEARREKLARRIVFTLHTVYHAGLWPREEEFQRTVLREADAVIVHSPLQEYELHAQARGYPENLFRIPHGTSVNPYLSWPRLRLAKRLGLDPGVLAGFVAAFLGFLRPDKGVETLLDSLDLLGEKSRGLRIIVGGEVRDEKLAETIAAHSGHGLVFIPRYLSTEELLMAAALADVIVLPYRDPPGKYAVSGILHLSMGSLKPIIGSNTPRLTELYTLAPRLVFRAGDPVGLAQLLSRLMDRWYYDLAVAYAGPLYSYAVRTSWPRMARRHLDLYRHLLGA